MSSGAWSFATMSLLALVACAVLSGATSSWGGLVPDSPDDLLSVPTSGSALLDRWDQTFELNLNTGRAERECEPLQVEGTAEVCKHFGYNMTTMPNFLNHQSQGEAMSQMNTYGQLLATSCSEGLPFLLCSYHFPVCTPHMHVPVTACRSFCRRVRSQCEPLMLAHNISWPETINCSELLEKTVINPRTQQAYVCVSSMDDVVRATRASPVHTTFVGLPVETTAATQPVRRPTPPAQKPLPPVETVNCSSIIKAKDCRRCRSLKVKKKVFRQQVFKWLIRGQALANSCRNTQGQRLRCVDVNITTVYFICPSKSYYVSPGQTTPVCLRRSNIFCPFCSRLKPSKSFLLGGSNFVGPELVIEAKRGIFLRYRPDYERNVTRWAKRFLGGSCPAEGR